MLSKIVMVTNMLPLGSATGCLVAGYFIVRGRRRTIMIFCMVIILTSFLSTVKNFYLLMLGRFISGMFYGIHGATFPLYNKEMSPPEMQG